MAPKSTPQWTFCTNHTHVLVCLLRDPTMKMRDIAELVGITERAVQRIVADLEVGGIVKRTRSGRRNTYEIDLRSPLRHGLEGEHTVGELLNMIADRVQS